PRLSVSVAADADHRVFARRARRRVDRHADRASVSRRGCGRVSADRRRRLPPLRAARRGVRVAMGLIEVDAVSKAFWIPNERRDTVREHLLGLLRRRRFDRLQALDAVSFDLRQGETLGIMGRNGSGKSTLLKIVCGVYTPDAGQVMVRGAVTPI